ncbi:MULTISPECIES: hypothetical protein [unclassified Microcoleus]|uniref:hypothetical protein n=1 Tax=unclassified Microcoleus TaxID=2642155 RepID=UPI002FD04AC0
MVIPALGSERQIPDAIVVASIYLSKKRGTPDEELSKHEYLSQESVAGVSHQRAGVSHQQAGVSQPAAHYRKRVSQRAARAGQSILDFRF